MEAQQNFIQHSYSTLKSLYKKYKTIRKLVKWVKRASFVISTLASGGLRAIPKLFTVAVSGIKSFISKQPKEAPQDKVKEVLTSGGERFFLGIQEEKEKKSFIDRHWITFGLLSLLLLPVFAFLFLALAHDSTSRTTYSSRQPAAGQHEETKLHKIPPVFVNSPPSPPPVP